MTFKFLITLTIFLGFTLTSFSQITNTRKWRKTENDTMQNAGALFEEEKYLMALPMFENLYNEHPKEEYLKYCYGKCALSRSDKHAIALKLLNEVYQNNKKANNIEYDLAKANHLNLNFDEAIVLIDKFISRKKIDSEIKLKAIQIKKYCLNGKLLLASPTKAVISNAGKTLNSENEEYVPVISADEQTMIFTYKGKESFGGLQNESLLPDPYGMYYEDAFQSVKLNNEWTKPQPIKTINTSTHDAPIAMSVDGLTLFVYRDIGDDHGDIYQSNFINGEWTNPEKLKGQVNSYSWDGSCSMTADGKYLYFSSERGGGFGGKDIYRATFLTDSTWGNVVNLGDSINTNLDDDAPFIHPDGVTLFYSSQAKNSMGGFDIFQTQLNLLDSSFSKSVNLGYPINTPDDDIYYVLSANGERGYYASGKEGGSGLKDIYSVTPGYVGKKPSVYIVKGKITLDNNPVIGIITVEITSKQNKKFGEFRSNSVNGNYLITLPADGQFKLTYTYKSLTHNKGLDISTINLNGYDEKNYDVNFETKIDTTPVAVTTPVILKDTLIAKIETKLIVKAQPVVKKEPEVITIIPSDNFKPNTVLQAKIKDYSEKYGDISAEGLLFRVQIAAFKYPKNYLYPHLKGLGAVEKLLLDDGITRITIGGNYKTLQEAYEQNKKVVLAGQRDAFVTVLYNGKRIYLEDLEKMGIYVIK